jgi:excisionase family DNA binding protein
MATPIIYGGATTMPRLITVEDAATLLAVSDTTVRNWIARRTIPYIQLPETGARAQYRIPLQGLLSSLGGNYDLAGDLKAIEEALDSPSPRAALREADATTGRRRPRRGKPRQELEDVDPEDIFDHIEAR